MIKYAESLAALPENAYLIYTAPQRRRLLISAVKFVMFLGLFSFVSFNLFMVIVFSPVYLIWFISYRYYAKAWRIYGYSPIVLYAVTALLAALIFACAPLLRGGLFYIYANLGDIVNWLVQFFSKKGG
jgi:hypothetical protein